jgi:hypothetical protein
MRFGNQQELNPQRLHVKSFNKKEIVLTSLKNEVEKKGKMKSLLLTGEIDPESVVL